MILIAQDMFEIWGFNREALKIEKKTTKKKTLSLADAILDKC